MNFGLIELIFVTGTVLGVAIWQYWSVHREIARDRARKASARSGHPVGEHPLDDR